MHQSARLMEGAFIEGLLQGVERQIAAQRTRRPPADDPPREHVDDEATYTNPRQVATQVRSATHSWFGRAAVNWRVTRPGGCAPVASAGTVVRMNARPRTAPASPNRRISRATVQRATPWSSRCSCFQTCGFRRPPGVRAILAQCARTAPRRAGSAPAGGWDLVLAPCARTTPTGRSAAPHRSARPPTPPGGRQ
jgi:hypothetical protein